MHAIVCVDSRGGLSFMGRRQSMDIALVSDILKSVTSKLFMNPYSKSQFSEGDIIAREDFLSAAGEDDYCFLEIDDITPHLKKVKTITIYCWNRAYPFDKSLPLDELKPDWQLVSASEFKGSSHERITKEVYKL